MKKILITTPTFSTTSDKPMELLKEAGFTVDFVKNATQAQILAHIADADAIINGEQPVTREAIELAPRLKVISHHGVGLDNIDLTAAEEHGVAVLNAKGSNTEAVADHTFMMAMALARRLPEGQAIVRAGTWQKIVGNAVWGATMGIIGLGAIGKALALRAGGFHMKILAFDISWDEEFARKNHIIRANPDEIYREADFISLHCALTKDNHGLIGLPEMRKMKKTAILINTARGPLIKSADLYTALSEGVIAGAGLDVYEEEPPAVDNPLFQLPNVIYTPHMAAYTSECLTSMSMMAAENAIAVCRKAKE